MSEATIPVPAYITRQDAYRPERGHVIIAAIQACLDEKPTADPADVAAWIDAWLLAWEGVLV